jgi:RAB protein geranylgeranyltransferase component A
VDAELQKYIVAVSLSLDGRITTQDGLAIIYRHLTSMGFFGPGFAAVYPKWGGISEIAQVACRAGAVGGAIYMLGTGISSTEDIDDEIKVQLTSGDTVKTRLLVRGEDKAEATFTVSRLVAVVASPLKTLFETVVEGAPLPAVAVIAIPAGSLRTSTGEPHDYPVYVMAHSSDTGECPSGQSKSSSHTIPLLHHKYMMIQTLNTYLHCLNFTLTIIPLTF